MSITCKCGARTFEAHQKLFAEGGTGHVYSGLYWPIATDGKDNS